MSFIPNPGKRVYEHGVHESNGKGKRRKSAAHQLKASPIPVSHAAFRILCPSSKAGGVIGKGGSVVSQIRFETGAKVIIEDAILGCDERIIVVEAYDKETGAPGEPSKEENAEHNATEGGVEKVPGENEIYDKPVILDDPHDVIKGLSPVEKALLLVFNRIGDGATEYTGIADNRVGASVFRMLIFSSQVGCLLGKGGSVIKRMSSDSGAQIRILPRDKIPSCVTASEELVQIIGGTEQTKKALILVSRQLVANPPRENGFFPTPLGGQHSHGHGQGGHNFPVEEMLMPSDSSAPPHMYGGLGFPGRLIPQQDFLIFHLLCSVEKIESVVGRGGTALRSLQFDTGCGIQVLDGKMACNDLIIEISGHVHPEDRISAAQDALLRIQSRISGPESSSMDNSATARLLLPSTQIGWVVGKSGAVINELKKLSGAYIRIIGKEHRPKCVPDNEDVVEISGDFEAVQEALVLITSRVRNHLFKDLFPSVNNGADPAFFDRGPPFHPMGRGEFSPPGMHPGPGGPPFFDGVGNMPPPGAFPFRDDRPFPQNMNQHGTPPHLSERLPLPLPPPPRWDPQGRGEGAGHMGFPEFAGFSERRIPGDSPIVTHTTVEAVVPSPLVPAIYGEGGGCLDQIRQISEAKVVITESKAGAMETVIIISGTPEQTHAAQSLIQAFVISESHTL